MCMSRYMQNLKQTTKLHCAIFWCRSIEVYKSLLVQTSTLSSSLSTISYQGHTETQELSDQRQSTMPPIRHPRSRKHNGRVPQSSPTTTKSDDISKSRPHHGAHNPMTSTTHIDRNLPSVRAEEWKIYSSDGEDDRVHHRKDATPNGSPSTSISKPKPPNGTPSLKATHSNAARSIADGLRSGRAQDSVPQQKSKVEGGDNESLSVRKSQHNGPIKSSLKIQLASAGKADSNARWALKKKLQSSDEWASLTIAEQEARKEAAIERLMRQRFSNRQSREYFEFLYRQEAPYDEKPIYPRAQPQGENDDTSKDSPNYALSQPSEPPASEDVHEITIPEPLKTELQSHDTKPRIGYIARSEYENYVFLAACVRHAPTEVKLDYDAIAQDLKISTETVVQRLQDLKKRLTEQGADLGNNPWAEGHAAFAAEPYYGVILLEVLQKRGPLSPPPLCDLNYHHL
ncbi:hypothetical protein EDD37DRAFT_496915 [Exophiala viscosa]|uniref:Myb-like DNA-binding domain-containing protein n=1 Tax=Exophiala viscosa TaxID=2486360 RepID=A0AAN6E0R1_9EURO|nr:hypothetical protein EDD36DRAFT_193630 [Exophiala viscosa]KAI1621816.1 hypothetical protein EDD37DRAFT_496915 [Exophiala viscosa]